MADDPRLLLAIEETFVEFLKENPDLAQVDIEPASDRDVFVGPTHIFVACPEAPRVGSAPQLGGDLFRARVVVTLVTPLHKSNDSERSALCRALEEKLRAPESFESPDKGIVVCGWHYAAPGEVSAERQKGDTYELLVGVRQVAAT